MGYYIDLLEPNKDLNVALDNLGNNLAVLYQECWDKNQRQFYGDKPFDLAINTFASMWFHGDMKLFMVYDDSNKPIGFLTGVKFRPMSYDAQVFQIHEWYVRGDAAIEQALFDHVVSAIRILGCQEIWCGVHPENPTPRVKGWKKERDFITQRYVKE